MFEAYYIQIAFTKQLTHKHIHIFVLSILPSNIIVATLSQIKYYKYNYSL